MKIQEFKNVCVVDKPLNMYDELREKRVSYDDREESFYICDLTDIVKKHINWTQLMPRVLPFYAVKCNDSQLVLKLLAALGTGFDCASKAEIKKIRDIGVSSSRIIFANPTKPDFHLKYAVSENVDLMTFDGEIELYKIQKNFPNARLVLRIRFDAKVAKISLGKKFGCDPEIEAPLLLSLAYRMGLQVVGISFHVGCGCMDSPVFSNAIYTARKLFDYAETLGYSLSLLDIGGGFSGDNNTSIVELSEAINTSIDAHFPNDNVTIIAEPGTYYVASAFTLVTRIHSKREVFRNGKLQSNMYFVNDGVYGSFNAKLTDNKPIKPLPLNQNGAELFKSSVWGPTCASLDELCESVQLPNMNIDDVLMFENMGAYTLPTASSFNGFPLATVDYYIERAYLDDINVDFNDM